MDSVQLNQLADRIDGAFGSDMPFTDRTLSDGDIDTLNRVFSDAGYQRYLQDQVNRQIIRDYLTNAVLLNIISDEQLERLTAHAGSTEGRSELSLYMLMSSVEQAGNLPLGPQPEPLQSLNRRPGGPPHLNLIRS
ncbi:hypothetical protein [Parahaliea aestuarii]|uniref:Uncharacterized protein n=1 Tax=Parahaliea aestuarii TaxID=1852021 RepID=A0A5C8ZXU8_9GAMM|nr:hypothetical protein [Parahaliea aestuarii]TXS92340.1 hypothetical protein FVW59_07910 [Parahaliea aestuarii]